MKITKHINELNRQWEPLYKTGRSINCCGPYISQYGGFPKI